MKALALISVLAASLAVSSCCCQSQSAPPLRPMPKNLVQDSPHPQPQYPVKVFRQKGK